MGSWLRKWFVVLSVALATVGSGAMADDDTEDVRIKVTNLSLLVYERELDRVLGEFGAAAKLTPKEKEVFDRYAGYAKYHMGRARKVENLVIKRWEMDSALVWLDLLLGNDKKQSDDKKK